jgi:transposase
MQVCKFFCDNSDCIRRIFTERLPEVTKPWARKTGRLGQQLQQIGLALGGAAGARLCHQIRMVVCGSTLLNHLKQLSLPEFTVPKILGVDDFAFRKGQRYGTILVDLELNQPIALLADRKAETLADWLIQHPGVEILSRDRSKTYKSGMDRGAPAAIQVADRFHLVQNLEETLEKVLSSYGVELKAIEQQHRLNSVPTGTIKRQRHWRVENRDADDTKLLSQIVAQHSALALAVELADEFLQLLRQQRADDFDDWLMTALKSSLQPFGQFAEGLLEDYAAVKASMMTTVSNGPVEGLNNRLKMLKRQMYGRAGLELLTKRFILAQ